MAISIVFNEVKINVGDSVDVHHKIKEEDKERIQIFSGVVIAIRGSLGGKSLTVRRLASGQIGVERIWHLNCPSLVKIAVKKMGKVRRAKLYYLRQLVGKRANKISVRETKKDEKKELGKSGRKSRAKISSK